MRVYILDEINNPGDFKYYKKEGIDGYAGILYKCPCGCGVVSTLPFKGENLNWNWDGDEDYPTVTPSILKRTPGVCKGWHGFLTKGKFIEC